MAATSGSNWSIVNRHSQRIDGVLHVNAPARKEFVVLCHGLLGTRNSILFPQLAQTLGEFNFVAFDFPLFKADNKSFRYGCYQEDVEDVKEVVDYFEAQLCSKFTAIIGHSRGANVALFFARRFGLPQRVVSLAARFEMDQSFYSKHTAAEIDAALNKNIPFVWNVNGRKTCFSFTVQGDDLREFLQQQRTIESLASLNSEIKVLLVHGEKDRMIPVADAQRFSATITNSRLVVLPKTDHLLRNAFEEVIALIKDFLSA